MHAGAQDYGDADPRAYQAEPHPQAERDPVARAARRPLTGYPRDSATAQAYVVGAGEYIQIIDVAGRQMTDFQCFSARKLDKGVENALDATVTRTLTGRSYPHPGLRKAFASISSRWLKTFGTQLAAMMPSPLPAIRAITTTGYPGHVNCTDNFNGARALWQLLGGKDGGAQLLLQHLIDAQNGNLFRRTLVEARRLRIAPRADRPRLRLLGLPR